MAKPSPACVTSFMNGKKRRLVLAASVARYSCVCIQSIKIKNLRAIRLALSILKIRKTINYLTQLASALPCIILREFPCENCDLANTPDKFQQISHILWKFGPIKPLRVSIWILRGCGSRRWFELSAIRQDQIWPDSGFPPPSARR